MSSSSAAQASSNGGGAEHKPVKIGQYLLLQTLGTGSFGKVKRKSKERWEQGGQGEGRKEDLARKGRKGVGRTVLE